MWVVFVVSRLDGHASRTGFLIKPPGGAARSERESRPGLETGQAGASRGIMELAETMLCSPGNWQKMNAKNIAIEAEKVSTRQSLEDADIKYLHGVDPAIRCGAKVRTHPSPAS